jgi:hypothetical protein
MKVVDVVVAILLPPNSELTSHWMEYDVTPVRGVQDRTVESVDMLFWASCGNRRLGIGGGGG